MKNILSITLLCLIGSSLLGQEKHQKSLIMMGSGFEITAYHSDPQVAWKAINAGIQEIKRIENLISSWDSNSQTSLLNQNAGKGWVQVDRELFDLIKRSLHISKITQGAFDISYASMDRLWKFDGSMEAFPTPKEVLNASQYIGYKKVLIDEMNSSVLLRDHGMKIGFGAIGKGYAAQSAMKVMKANGIKKGVVNAAGDLITWAADEDETFPVVISDPDSKERAIAKLNVANAAIVTSGDYERFIEFNNRRYAHIIDPRTGYPTTGIKSVTIVAKNAELADALSTGVFVLGISDGLQLINQLPDIECLIVDDYNQIHYSENLDIETKGS